jgi:ATP synthase protein I
LKGPVLVKQGDDKSQLLRQLALASTIPLLMAVGPLVGYLIGNWLDSWLGTAPWLMVFFIVLGFVAAGKEIFNMLRKLNKDL